MATGVGSSPCSLLNSRGWRAFIALPCTLGVRPLRELPPRIRVAAELGVCTPVLPPELCCSFAESSGQRVGRIFSSPVCCSPLYLTTHRWVLWFRGILPLGREAFSMPRFEAPGIFVLTPEGGCSAAHFGCRVWVGAFRSPPSAIIAPAALTPMSL